VAHSLSVVTVQAGVGRRSRRHVPARRCARCGLVEVTGRGALEELRRILGLLRDDEPEAPSLAPVPGIEDLEDLADSVRAAGIPVGLAVTGDAAGLPPAAALTVYRIVQEALTNVVKARLPGGGVGAGCARARTGADHGDRQRVRRPLRGRREPGRRSRGEPPASTGSSACANAPRRSAARWMPPRCLAADSGSGPSFRYLA